ncbi:MAG: ATP-binding protein, partial [Bifidobacterium sp.]|nr:ATP-binding protein [Bifidobacterium sp.]
RPRADREPVPGTSIADLDPRLVDEFVRSVRHMTPTLVDVESDEILRRLNVLRDSGEATVGGLYALGIYPQQFLPHLSLTAAVIHEDSDDTEDDRATNRRDFTGPIATILDAAVDWVAQNVTSTMTVNDDGYGSTRYAVPLKAVREVVANALVHRDLTDATSGRVVELRLTPRGLVLTSPGGLWGLTVEQLGTPDGKSAVNEFLYTICRHISGHTGRVIEAMGTGIRTTQKALAAASLEPPRFYDNGLRFTVMFPSHSLYNEQELTWLATLGPARLSAHHKNALLALRTRGSLTNADYRKITGVDPVAARKELRQLEQLGLITRVGERRGTRYELAQGHRND